MSESIRTKIILRPGVRLTIEQAEDRYPELIKGQIWAGSLANTVSSARQRAVTCCYTSLESMNMRFFALLEASDGA